MRLNEISDIDKTYLRLKNIDYDFTDMYQSIITSYKLIGNNIALHAGLKTFIILIQQKTEVLFRQGIPDNDIDIISIKEMYINLENMKKSL